MIRHILTGLAVTFTIVTFGFGLVAYLVSYHDPELFESAVDFVRGALQ